MTEAKLTWEQCALLTLYLRKKSELGRLIGIKKRPRAHAKTVVPQRSANLCPADFEAPTRGTKNYRHRSRPPPTPKPHHRTRPARGPQSQMVDARCTHKVADRKLAGAAGRRRREKHPLPLIPSQREPSFLVSRPPASTLFGRFVRGAALFERPTRVSLFLPRLCIARTLAGLRDYFSAAAARVNDTRSSLLLAQGCRCFSSPISQWARTGLWVDWGRGEF